MPLAKSAPEPAANIPARIDIPTPNNYDPNPGFDGVPFEVYRYFNVSPSEAKREEIKQIKDVFSWANKDKTHISDSLFSLRQLENKLGSPSIGETRYSKIWNWVRVSNIVDDLQTERDRQVSRITQRRQEEAKRIREQKDRELRELERKRKSEESAIRKARENELKQFKRLRQAYE